MQRVGGIKLADQVRHKRNKFTNYDVDIHIRVPNKYKQLLQKEAEEKYVTLSLLLRNIVEEHIAITKGIEIEELLNLLDTSE